MARWVAVVALTIAGWAGAPAAGAVITLINFDDRPGQPPPFTAGTPVPAQYLVNNQYSALGVLFDSGGGGVVVSAPSNPVSPPNTVAATATGPVISYVDPVTAVFQVGATPAVVDSVSITLTNSSSTSFLDAFDINGALLGTSSGGASATLTTLFPGQIHSSRIRQGPMAFDNFTFSNLALVPEPGGSLAVLLVVGGALSRRKVAGARASRE
jgi:hypothetical protein